MTKLLVWMLSVNPYSLSSLKTCKNKSVWVSFFVHLNFKGKSCCGSRASWIQKRWVMPEKMPVKSLKGQLCFCFAVVVLVKSKEIAQLVYFMHDGEKCFLFVQVPPQVWFWTRTNWADEWDQRSAGSSPWCQRGCHQTDYWARASTVWRHRIWWVALTYKHMCPAIHCQC